MALEKTGATSVREAFVQQIEDKILSGELQPGDRLPPAKELGAQMGVSLTVVNAGVSELVTKGFLTVKPRHGTYVADWRENGSAETLMSLLRHNGGRLTQHDVRSYCESRVALDPFVAELVIQRSSNEQLRALGAYVEHCYFTTYYNRVSIEDIAAQIRAAGVDHTYLSTDFGQVKSPYSDEGIIEYAERLEGQGFTPDGLAQMFRVLPEKLLGKA